MLCNGMSKGFLAWHPQVHQRFGERLFFFLLALKPYRQRAFVEALRELLKAFGVSVEHGHEGYCSYELLGDLDHLIRVWLPADQDVKFLEQARAQLPNLSTILQFSVHDVVEDWRFAKKEGEAETQFQQKLKDLTTASVLDCQSAAAPDKCQHVIADGLAFWVREIADEKASHPIKAFISLKPPENVTEDQRIFIQEVLVSRIKSSTGIGRCTFYSGIGFTRMLAKVVSDDFLALSQVVSQIGNEYGGLGVSSSTYAATLRVAEGDAIAPNALREGPVFSSQALRFAPALNATSPAAQELRTPVAEFIQKKVIPAKLKPEDELSMKELLNAVLIDNEDAALQPLFLPTIITEREVRLRLLRLVNITDGNLKWLFDFAHSKSQSLKSADTIPLGLALLAAREKMRLVQPLGTAEPPLDERELRRTTEIRNRLMHGGRIHLAEEWSALAEHLLVLYRIRDTFIPALDECLRQAEPSA